LASFDNYNSLERIIETSSVVELGYRGAYFETRSFQSVLLPRLAANATGLPTPVHNNDVNTIVFRKRYIANHIIASTFRQSIADGLK